MHFNTPPLYLKAKLNFYDMYIGSILGSFGDDYDERGNIHRTIMCYILEESLQCGLYT
jgi:hypothetical protein